MTLPSACCRIPSGLTTNPSSSAITTRFTSTAPVARFTATSAMVALQALEYMPHATPGAASAGRAAGLPAELFGRRFEHPPHPRIGQVVQPELQRIHPRFRRQRVDVRFPRERVAVHRRRAPRANRERIHSGGIPAHPSARRGHPLVRDVVKRIGFPIPRPEYLVVPEHDLAGRHAGADLHHRRRTEPVVEELLLTTVDHLHRFAGDLRQARRFHSLVRFGLAAEPAADVAGNDPHLVGRHSQRRGHRALHLERSLRTGPHRRPCRLRFAPSPSASRWERGQRNCSRYVSSITLPPAVRPPPDRRYAPPPAAAARSSECGRKSFCRRGRPAGSPSRP